MADNSEQISELEAARNSGISSTSIDGNSTSFDHDLIRRALVELKNQDDNSRKRRSRMSINLA